MERNDDDADDEFYDAMDNDLEEAVDFEKKESRSQDQKADHLEKADFVKDLCDECGITDGMVLECQRAIFPLQLDTYTIVRFIVGSDMVVKDAIRKIVEDVDWRRRVRPHEIRKELVNPIISSGEITILPLPDRDGYPVVYLRSRLHKTFPLPRGCNYVDMMLYVIESALANSRKVTAIADLSSIGWKNMDVPLVIQGLNLYNNHYPERLGNCIFIGSDFWFHYGFKLVKHLVGPRTLPRIHLVTSVKELEKFVDPLALPEDCVLSPNIRRAIL